MTTMATLIMTKTTLLATFDREVGLDEIFSQPSTKVYQEEKLS
jgi:hypothetical protein